MKVIKPPNQLPHCADLFLAGSIEMGAATNWQLKVEQALSDREGVLLNPRREEWDSSWVQSIDNPQFVEQVNWEIDGFLRSDYVAIYLDPATKAPISLLELGLLTDHHRLPGTLPSQRLIVCCPNGYWRKGNVDIICQRFGHETVPTLEELIQYLQDVL